MKIIEFVRSGLVLVAVQFAAFIVHASDDLSPAQSLAKQLQEVGALRATFSQVVRDNDQSVLDESSGWVAWQQPSQFRWEVLEPWEQSLLIDGENYYQYDRDLEQLLIQPLSGEISVLPKLLLSGDAEAIEQTFNVKVKSDSAGRNGYELLPVQQEALFSQVLIWFQSSQLVSMQVIDELGQLSEFGFGPLSAEIQLPDEQNLFVLEPEPNTDVIYQ